MTGSREPLSRPDLRENAAEYGDAMMAWPRYLVNETGRQLIFLSMY